MAVPAMRPHTLVTCGEERGPFRLVFLSGSDDMLFFPECIIPCFVICPSTFFLVSPSLRHREVGGGGGGLDRKSTRELQSLELTNVDEIFPW